MMRKFSLSAGLLLLATPALSQTCPPVSSDEVRRVELMEQVRIAPDAVAAQRLTNLLWEIWADAPDDRSQELLDAGIERRSAFDLINAEAAFEELIAYCPHYAEGYNQRAFVRFIRQEYAPALEDLDVALSLSPEHLGALTGRSMAFMALGRDAEALRDLRAALELNPWLKERGLLKVLEERAGVSDL